MTEEEAMTKSALEAPNKLKRGNWSTNAFADGVADAVLKNDDISIPLTEAILLVIDYARALAEERDELVERCAKVAEACLGADVGSYIPAQIRFLKSKPQEASDE